MLRRRDESRRIGCDPRPIGGQGIERRQFLGDLPDGTPRQRDAPAQVLHALALGFGRRRDPDELILALGEGREIEAECFDDPALALSRRP